MGAIKKCSWLKKINGGITCWVNREKKVMTNGSLTDVGEFAVAMAMLSHGVG